MAIVYIYYSCLSSIAIMLEKIDWSENGNSQNSLFTTDFLFDNFSTTLSQADQGVFSLEAKNIFESLWKDYLPVTKTTLWSKEFYFSQVFLDTTWRKICVGYIKVWDKRQSRLFYYSSTWGVWRSSPFKDKKWFSKWTDIDGSSLTKSLEWFSYDTWTILDARLQKFLSFQKVFPSLDSIVLIDQHFQSTTDFGTENKNQFANEISGNNAFLSANKDIPTSFSHLHKSLSPSKIIDLYRNLQLPNDFVLSDDPVQKHGISQHPYIWDVQSMSMKALLWDQKIVIYVDYALEEPSLCWIKKISYANREVSSFGIEKDQINGWLFTAKPLEHDDQVPHQLSHNHYKDTTNIDIRPYIQENPLITLYRKKIFL